MNSLGQNGGENPPQNTVYVSNINDKLKKAELMKNLYHIFSQQGNILEIHVKSSFKFRGQVYYYKQSLLTIHHVYLILSCYNT